MFSAVGIVKPVHCYSTVVIIDDLIKQCKITEIAVIGCSVWILLGNIIIRLCAGFHVATLLIVKCSECRYRVLITQVRFKEYKITCSAGTLFTDYRNSCFLTETWEYVTAWVGTLRTHNSVVKVIVKVFVISFKNTILVHIII